MNDPLSSGNWFNRSSKLLRISAILIAAGFVVGCVATAYYVAQYFVCIGECRPGTPSLALLAVSAFFGLIPAVGTGALGYLIVKGLWDDSEHVAAAENSAPAPRPIGGQKPVPEPNLRD